MTALVARMSRTGDTERVDEATYGPLGCEVEILPIDRIAGIGRCGPSFLHLPVQRLGPAPKTAAWGEL